MSTPSMEYPALGHAFDRLTAALEALAAAQQDAQDDTRVLIGAAVLQATGARNDTVRALEAIDARARRVPPPATEEPGDRDARPYGALSFVGKGRRRRSEL